MAAQRKAKKSNPAKSCKCDRCHTEAHSIPETSHRNCSGEAGANPRTYANRVDGAKRGTWRG